MNISEIWSQKVMALVHAGVLKASLVSDIGLEDLIAIQTEVLCQLNRERADNILKLYKMKGQRTFSGAE